MNQSSKDRARLEVTRMCPEQTCRQMGKCCGSPCRLRPPLDELAKESK